MVEERRTADEESWPAKVTGYALAAGDTIEIAVPSSGGYGDPLRARPERVLLGRPGRLHDARAGRARLRRRDRPGAMAVDVEATRQAPQRGTRPRGIVTTADPKETSMATTESNLQAMLDEVFATDSHLYQGRGFQRRVGFGERPAIIHIDLSNA